MESISLEQADIIGEIANICTGTAATALSMIINRPTNITTPNVEVLTKEDLERVTTDTDNQVAKSKENLQADTLKSISLAKLTDLTAEDLTAIKGLDEFRESMLCDKHIERIVDFSNPKDCFPNANISGGVCYLLWNKGYNGNCLFTNVVNGEETSSKRIIFKIII